MVGSQGRCAVARALILFSAFTIASANNLQACLSQLEAHFPGSASYTRLRSLSFNTELAAPPAAIVLPRNANEVSKAILCARGASLQVCARSGGHAYDGRNQCSGVMLDMSPMDEVSLTGDVATLGAGVPQGQALFKVHAQGRWFSSGVCPGVGVSGYLLGGGHGPYEGRLGVTCDSLQEVTMVTRDGEIVKANKYQREDLFRGMCGAGGGQFGIVTEFKLRTASSAPFDRSVAFKFWWPQERVGEVLEKWARYDEAGGDTWVRTEVGNGVKAFGACYNVDSVAECIQQLEKADFYNTPGRKQQFLGKARNALDIHAFIGPGGDWGSKFATDLEKSLTTYQYADKGAGNGRLHKSAFLTLDVPPDASFWQAYGDFCSASRTGWMVCQTNLFNNEIDTEKDNHFAHRAAHVSLQVILGGGSDTSKAEVYKFMTEHFAKYTTGVYVNYQEPELGSNYAQLYWGKKLPELSRLKAEYDPDFFFANPQPIPTNTGSSTGGSGKCALAFAIGSYTNLGWMTARGEGVTIATLDKKLETANVMGRPVSGDNPSYCAYAGNALHCANENQPATVTSMTGLKTSTKAQTGSNSATHVSVLDDKILVANYGGAFSVLKKDNNGQMKMTSYPIPKHLASGGGPNGWEQNEPHPHMALPIGGDDVIVPDLGSDTVWRFGVDMYGQITMKQQIKLTKRDGPRHAVYSSKTRNLYVLNELSQSVVRLGDSTCGGSGFAECERKALTSGSKTGTAAAIRLSKDGRFLYASLRYPGTDEGKIIGFAIESNGAIGMKIGEWSSHGVHPRDFFLVEGSSGCPSYLAIVNRDSDNLVLVNRDTSTGVVGSVAHQLAVKTPTSVVQIPRDSVFAPAPPAPTPPVPTPPVPVPAPPACQKANGFDLCKGNEKCCPAGTSCYAYNDHVSACMKSCPTGWGCEKSTCLVHNGYSLCKGNENCCPTGTHCYAFNDHISACMYSCPLNWDCDFFKPKVCHKYKGYSLCKGNEDCCPAGTKCHAFSDYVSACMTSCPPNWRCNY